MWIVGAAVLLVGAVFVVRERPFADVRFGDTEASWPGEAAAFASEHGVEACQMEGVRRWRRCWRWQDRCILRAVSFVQGCLPGPEEASLGVLCERTPWRATDEGELERWGRESAAANGLDPQEANVVLGSRLQACTLGAIAKELSGIAKAPEPGQAGTDPRTAPAWPPAEPLPAIALTLGGDAGPDDVRDVAALAQAVDLCLTRAGAAREQGTSDLNVRVGPSGRPETVSARDGSLRSACAKGALYQLVLARGARVLHVVVTESVAAQDD